MKNGLTLRSECVSGVCLNDERFKFGGGVEVGLFDLFRNYVGRYYVELLPRTPSELRRQLKARRDFSPPRDHLIPKFVTN